MSQLARNTERAITLLTVDRGNPYLYWPSYMRTGKRIKPDGTVTTNAPTEKEQIERIVEADPLGWLLAAMNGLPMPVLHKNKDFDPAQPITPENQPYVVHEEMANIGMRRDIAQHLLTKLISPKRKERAKPTLPKGASIFDQVNERAAPAESDE
jgi:hypothetical protein